MTWRRTLSALAWTLVSFAYPLWATTLELNFVDTEGRPVQVAKAELLLVAWGQTERIELETLTNSLSLVLEPAWLRSQWPHGRFNDQDGVYLYLQASPLAAIRSHQFRWPGASGYEGTTTIAFPGGRQVVVEEGDDASMTLAFRTKSDRRVRIVDPEGRPMSGVGIDVSMFWSDRNHCGVLAGSEPLGTHVTDADGWIEVPDGDFEYALTLGRGLHNHVFVESRGTRSRLETHLAEPKTDVVVREFPVRPLEMRVRRGDEPAAGIQLHGFMADCCMSAGCSGPLATTDEAGHIRLDDFRPEKWRWIFLVDDDEFWRMAPASLPAGIVQVQFSSPPTLQKGVSYLEGAGSPQRNSWYQVPAFRSSSAFRR